MKIAYFVHDIGDAAVHRRVRTMRSFAEVTLLGFHRAANSTGDLPGIPTIDLGRTTDARLGQRVFAVLRALANAREWRTHLAGSTVVIARQLEMLVLAALVRKRIGPDVPLVFECLDIHRLMLKNNAIGFVLRYLEEHLLRSCRMLIVSSPAFIRNHFDRYRRALPPHLLLENKVTIDDVPGEFLAHIDKIRAAGPPPGPPWRIGWFGVIRCRRSLDLLARLATSLPGQVEVVIRGRPRRNILPDFDRIVATTPGLTFLGEYDRHTDLSQIYGDVHFTWAMDFYEAGQNSDWLLPNRLYEGTLYGAVPMASASVETGRWLRNHRAGVLLEDRDHECLWQSLLRYFSLLDSTGYIDARASLAKVPLSDILDDAASSRHFASTLRALPAGHAS